MVVDVLGAVSVRGEAFWGPFIVVSCKELRLWLVVSRLHIVQSLYRNVLPLDLFRIHM